VSSFRELVAAARTEAGDEVSHLSEVLRAARALPEGERFLHVRVPRRILAFSRRDSLRPRFAQARRVAEEHGFTAVVRHVGGAFAPAHPGSLVIEHFGSSPDASLGSRARFVEHAEVLRSMLAGLGLDARVGELPGEYCPGEHSINVAGRVKVAGLAQRVSGTAWVVSTVLQVHGAAELREVTLAVAEELGEQLEPATIGDLEGLGVRLGVDELAARVARAFVQAGLVAPEDLEIEGARTTST